MNFSSIVNHIEYSTISTDNGVPQYEDNTATHHGRVREEKDFRTLFLEYRE